MPKPKAAEIDEMLAKLQRFVDNKSLVGSRLNAIKNTATVMIATISWIQGTAPGITPVTILNTIAGAEVIHD